jgi:hypothetical protein
MTAETLIATHPDVHGSTNDALAHAIESTLACALACSVCADACLAEDSVRDLVQCIRLDQDCADVCRVTSLLASRRSGSNEALIAVQLDVCMRACAACAAECERHADMHEHCRLCAEACRACETACREARDTFATVVH